MRETLRNECPPLEKLAALFDGQLTDAESAAARAHVAACPMCEADWRMLADFVEAKPEPAEDAAVRKIAAAVEKARKPARAGWFSWAGVPKLAGALAALVLVAAVGLQYQSQKSTDLSGFQESGALRSSARLELLQKGDFSAPLTEISWTSVSSAVSYLIVVSEVDGAVLWRGESKDAHLILPEQVRSLLLPKKTVVCQVTALDRSGSRLAQSEATRLRYLPGGDAR